MTVRGFDRNPNARLSTFIRRLLKRLFDGHFLLSISWSGIVKGKKKKALEEKRDGARDMIGLKSYSGVVNLMKGLCLLFPR